MAASDRDKKTLQGMIAKGQNLDKILQAFPELEEAARELHPNHFGMSIDLTPTEDKKQDFRSDIAENLARYRLQHGGSGAALVGVSVSDEIAG